MPRWSLTRSEARRFGALGALLLWCALLLAARVAWSGTLFFAFLCWNLFLAAVPLAASTLLRRLDGTGGPVARAMCFVAWLLFLPNAPYIVTDLVHLAPRPPVPLWYDVALLLSCAGTGLLLAYVSVLDVHAVLDRRFGRRLGWGAIVGSLVLSGYGIYLGRFVRLNSWEVVTDPAGIVRTVAGHVLDPLGHPRAVGVTLVYGLGLALGYAVVRALVLGERAALRAGESG